MSSDESTDDLPEVLDNRIKIMKNLRFTLQGTEHSVNTSKVNPNTTLNEYLRNHLHLTGTKYMCYEGGCGACIVAATFDHPRTGTKQTIAVNSCLVSLMSCQGWDIETIENLGNRNDGYHELQQKIVQFNATQCGFCTPGMIMNMYALQKSGKMTMAEIENSFGGNICRCTGYRPILSAFKSLASDADETLLGITPDIEELQLCKKTNCQKTCSKPCSVSFNEYPTLFQLQSENIELEQSMVSTTNWYKVKEVKEIFSIFQSEGNSSRSYKLVAGNTAKGVYRDMAEADYYIDVSEVKELADYSLNTSKLILGGNMTIADVMDVFQTVAGNDDGYKHLETIVKHLDLVATVPVRNIGTLAGNLSMKYLHNEFPSDIFLIFEVLDSRIVLDNGRKQQRITPREFLTIDMEHKIIRSIEIPPLDSSYKVETYKIMPRAQNAHAFLNAGFRFKLNGKNVVKDVAIVYGGINPDFVHAQNAEGYVKGKKLFDNGIMQKLFGKLDGELRPDHVYPDPSPEYRKNLAIALMYKFILSIAPDNLVSKEVKSGADKLIRADVSTGAQEYKTNKSLYPIGEPIHKLEAADQASGEAKYITDMPDLPNQLFAAFVTAQAQAGSVVKSIDPSVALAIDGVEAFFQASDIDDLKGVNSFMSPDNEYFYYMDEDIFIPIGGTIKYYYQPVGIIVAKSQSIARTAARRVNVKYKESKSTPLLTVRDVLQSKDVSRIHHEDSFLSRKQETSSAVEFKGQFDCNWQYHYHMELQVVNVIPDDDGGFFLYPTTQWIDAVQNNVARALNLPAHKLSMKVKRLGGAFGAKLTRNNYLACAATLASLKLRKPVKFMLDLTTNMNVIGKRNAISCDYEIGVDDDGRIGYLNSDIYNNTGAYGNARIENFIMELYQNTYVTDGFQTDLYWVQTDNPAATMMRGPGSFEGCALIENMMEHISYQVDKDPIDVRLANLNTDANSELKTLIDDCLKWSDYRKRRSEIEDYNKDNRWRKRGIAIIPMTFGLSFLGTHYVQVSVYQVDGTVAIAHGGTEIGQGINTKAAQVTAYMLGIDISMVHVKPTNDFTAPNNFSTGGSVTTEFVCMALKEACTTLKNNIDNAALKKNLTDDSTWLQKVKNAFNEGVSLTQNYMAVDNPDDSKNYKIYGIAVSEVEVDVLTGTYVIQRVDLLEDAGNSLNPYIDIGQCEGAFVMGAGNWTSEHIILDDKGALATNNTWTYKVPGARDIPVDFRVKLPDGVPNPVTPFKNKATSEPPCCLGFSVPLAIRHAIRTARTQADPKNDPWAPIDGPSTIEWTFLNSLNDYKQYTL